MDEKKNEIILFENQGVRLEVNLKDETVWFTQKQMAELFGKDRRTITRHIQNIYKDEELSESSVYSFFEHTAEEGIEPNNFMFARNLAGKKAVFLIKKNGFFYTSCSKIVFVIQYFVTYTVFKIDNQ